MAMLYALATWHFVLRVVRSKPGLLFQSCSRSAHMWELNNNPRVRSMRAKGDFNKKSGKKSSVGRAPNEWHL